MHTRFIQSNNIYKSKKKVARIQITPVSYLSFLKSNWGKQVTAAAKAKCIYAAFIVVKVPKA